MITTIIRKLGLKIQLVAECSVYPDISVRGFPIIWGKKIKKSYTKMLVRLII